jgi:hypothetical protein
VSRGRKVQRHACSVIGMQQYRRMESNSANAPLAKGSVGVEAARKSGERETNASNSFEAPQAAEERETNAPCRREAAENVGTRENQRVGGGGYRCKERRESADQPGTAAATGSRDDCRVLSGWRVAQPGSGRSDHHGYPVNNKPGPW